MKTHQQKSFFIGAALAFIPGVLWGLSGQCPLAGDGTIVNLRCFDGELEFSSHW